MSATSKAMLLAALGGLLLAPAARAEDQQKAQGDGDKVPCWGINKCKGLGDCGREGCRFSGCHGSNTCRGQGFLRLEKDTCLKIENGALTRPAENSGSSGSAKQQKKDNEKPAKKN